MLVFYALMPIVFMVINLVFLNKPAKIIIPIALCLYLIISFFIWKIDFLHLVSYSVLGFFKAIDIFLIIFGAVLLLNILKESGGLNKINIMFSNISNDKRVQLLIIGFLFEAFMEGVAGFGSPGVLVAPLFVSLGFPPLLAIILGLMFDGIPVIFGAVGAPVSATISSLSNILEISRIDVVSFTNNFINKIAVINLISGFFIPIFAIFITIFYFGGKKTNKIKSFIEILPFTIYVSFIFLINLYFFSKIGYALPSILSSIIALIIVIFTTIKLNFLIPKNIWNFESKDLWLNSWKSNVLKKENANMQSNISLFNALLPYLLVAILLIISRLEIFGFVLYIKKAIIHIGDILTFLHLPKIHFDFFVLNNPGIFPFIFVAIFIGYFYKLSLKTNIIIWKKTFIQLRSSGIILVYIFIITQLMIYSKDNSQNLDSMLSIISKFIATLSGQYFLWISSFIGALGSFLGGSSAVSNILFSSVQFETALYTKLPLDVVIALQSTGSALATMITINKIIAVSATVNIVNMEGKILKITLFPLFLYCILATCVSYLIYL